MIRPGPGSGHGVGRPPVLSAVLSTGRLRDGALHRRLLRQRGVPRRSEAGGARWTHLQGLPHPLPAPQRPPRLRHLPQVSRRGHLAQFGSRKWFPYRHRREDVAVVKKESRKEQNTQPHPALSLLPPSLSSSASFKHIHRLCDAQAVSIHAWAGMSQEQSKI